jgi:nicotinamide N-methyltransferase
MDSDGDDPEDILSSCLLTLYEYHPITLSSAGSIFNYRLPDTSTVTLCTPDTQAANWSLHASSVWAASRFLADHLEYLDLPVHISRSERVRLLELGAAAGLLGPFKTDTSTHLTRSSFVQRFA